MSMISAQIDELRELATRYDELQVGAVKAVTMPSDMGSILHEAADTIWQLRDDSQRAHRENAKLRELILDVADMMGENAKLRELVERLRSADNARDVLAENAKLRELVKEMRVCLEDECKRCHEWGDACDLEHQMRDLGVEVDK